MSDDFDYEEIITEGFKTQARILGETLREMFDFRTSTIRYNEVMDAYAASLGRSSDTLTDQERQIAFLRASMRDGDE